MDTKSNTTPKKPVSYSGTGSAIGNYFSPEPVSNDFGYTQKEWESFDSKNGKHKYILSMLHQMGWTKEVNGKTVADMEAFAHWLKTKSPVKKPLTKMEDTKKNNETSKVVYAFEKTVKHFFS